MYLDRRYFLALGLGFLAPAPFAYAQTPREITWDDLIPPGVPYGEIIGEGEIDMLNDTWNPIFDENARKLNEALHGAYIRMPGFIVPLEINAEGVSEFVLVPYQGACIHTPPPPPQPTRSGPIYYPLAKRRLVAGCLGRGAYGNAVSDHRHCPNGLRPNSRAY